MSSYRTRRGKLGARKTGTRSTLGRGLLRLQSSGLWRSGAAFLTAREVAIRFDAIGGSARRLSRRSPFGVFELVRRLRRPLFSSCEWPSTRRPLFDRWRSRRKATCPRRLRDAACVLAPIAWFSTVLLGTGLVRLASPYAHDEIVRTPTLSDNRAIARARRPLCIDATGQAEPYGRSGVRPGIDVANAGSCCQRQGKCPRANAQHASRPICAAASTRYTGAMRPLAT